ncbi:MAG: regulatory signaling modulator protein AmpE [Gammaproteobacteria bacterium]|nr:regulatory signaling modulator protein AmpE [Gammaproteobacteria bacterium]
MIIITVFICLFAERFLSSLYVLRNFTWLEVYSNFILKYFTSIQFKKGKIPVLFIVLPPAIIVGLIDRQLYQTFLPFEFLFSIIILLYSFGPKTFYDQSKELCRAEDISDNTCACWYAEQILNRPLERHEQINLPHIISQSLFSISNDRILAPIFWFVILGPMGAILFRCSSQLYLAATKYGHTQHRYKKIVYSSSFLYAILNWIPSRLSAFGFAAMGNFSSAMKNYSKIKKLTFQLNQESNERLLISVGSGAINLPEISSETTPDKISDALAILRRNTQLWMGTIALLTLTGWLM